jgi:hypothetical protein
MKSKLVRFEPELLDAIEREAKIQHVKASPLIRAICREYIEKRKADRAAMKKLYKAVTE